MDLTSPSVIKELLKKNNSKPNKLLGQNFLIDKNILSKIVSAAEINSTDTIIEVGPGIGTLTQELAKSADNIVAIEKDKKMIEILKETLNGLNSIHIIKGDILRQDLSSFKNYSVVANMPYYLTSPLIRKLLESENQPKEIILMIQKEVAQRICAKPPRMSLLAVSVQYYAEPKIISYVSKNCFWPAPKIDSAIIKIIPARNASRSDAGGPAPDLFFKIVKAGFSQPRKQLAGNLSKMLKLKKDQVDTWLLSNNIKPTQRAETLFIADWQNLTNSFPQLTASS